MPILENIIKQSNNNALSTKHQHIKRPLNAFMLWSLNQRRKRSSKYQGVRSVQLSKLLGIEWKQLPIEEKQPFVDEANRMREQHMRDHPDYKRSRRRRPKCGQNIIEQLVVPHSMSYYLPPTFGAQESTSIAPVSSCDTEKMGNLPIGCFPTCDMYCTTYPAILSDSNPQYAESRTFTSMTGHDSQSQAAPTYQYEYMKSDKYACKYVLNIRDSVHSNTCSSCFVCNSFLASQIEESKWDSVLSDTSSSSLNHSSSSEPLQQLNHLCFTYNLDQ